jgi:hypothetical protein
MMPFLSFGGQTRRLAQRPQGGNATHTSPVIGGGTLIANGADFVAHDLCYLL